MYTTSSNLTEDENHRSLLRRGGTLNENMTLTSDLPTSATKDVGKKISFTIGKKRKINGKVSPTINSDHHLSKRSTFVEQESVTQEFLPSPNGSTSSEGGGGGSGFSSGDNDSVGSSSVEDERRYEEQSIVNEEKDTDIVCESHQNHQEEMGYSSTMSHDTDKTHTAQHHSLHDEYDSSVTHVNNPLASKISSTHRNDIHIHDRENKHFFSPTKVHSNGWRVKLYRLNADGSWDDCGTGRIACHTSDVPSTVRSGSPLPTSSSKYNLHEKSYRVPSPVTSGSASFYRNWASVEEDIYKSLGEPTLCMYGEIPMNVESHNTTDMNEKSPKVLLRTRVLLRESYQRQGDNIITWCEPYFSSAKERDQVQNGNNNGGVELNRWDESISEENNGVDLALSFQDNAGCRDIWNEISKIQRHAHEIYDSLAVYSSFDERIDIERVDSSRKNGQSQNTFSENSTQNDSSEKTVNSSQYKTTPRKLKGNSIDSYLNQKASSSMEVKSDNNKFKHGLWVHGDSSMNGIDFDEQDFIEAEAVAKSVKSHYDINRPIGSQPKLSDSIDLGHISSTVKLPSPPTLVNLEEIADIIVASQPHQRESIASFVSRMECSYLKQLLQVFPVAEAKNDYHALATLASIIKSCFLFNDPSIIELVASDEQTFEACCCCLEYDPDLREKANHRWFIRDRLRFRSVIEIEDEDLIDSIHKSFRVTFIRDTLLRPTMDESCLTTLSSLLTFTHAEIVKAVMCAPRNQNSKTQDSYLVQIIRLLGEEIISIRELEWEILERKGRCPKPSKKNFKGSTLTVSGSVSGCTTGLHTPWTQHLAPQDDSLSSRRIRRSGCLSFLKEMFNIVRTSLQQNDKDDFYAMIVLMDVKLYCCDNGRFDPQKSEENTVNLLSLLGAVLADINSDVSERVACLEILSTIAMHDSSYIRKHVLDEFSLSKNDVDKNGKGYQIIPRPEPNGEHQVIFACPPTDLLLSLLYVMATESDAGVMIQTCEVMRIILDTEMVNENGHLDLGGVIDNEEDELIGSDNISFLIGSNPHNGHGGGSCEQNSFLNLFYDHYVPWFVAPFQFFIMVPKSAIPYSWKRAASPNQSLLQLLEDKHRSLKEMKISRSGVFKLVSTCSVRISFSLELLSFCIRAHFFRMKRYLINSRVLIHVMKMLSPRTKSIFPSGDRCVKLGALRCLRSILSLKDDFYNRHIIQNKLFTPVFETFRQNLVGDNLIASSIIEICEFIRTENIRAMIEYIVTKHLCQDQTLRNTFDSSDTKHPPSLEDVATPYVDTLTQLRQKYEENMKKEDSSAGFVDDGGRGMVMNEKAMEDQRKFRETDEEESYFFDDEGTANNNDYGGFQ